MFVSPGRSRRSSTTNCSDRFRVSSTERQPSLSSRNSIATTEPTRYWLAKGRNCCSEGWRRSRASRGVVTLRPRHTTDDTFGEPIANAAGQALTCGAPPFGPRFRPEETDTLVYPTDDRQWVQTTFAFCEEVLATRQPLHEHAGDVAHQRREVTARGAN